MLRAERLLVFAPHIDDAEFGCGGLIYKRTQLGLFSRVLVLSNSDYHRQGKKISKSDRRQEAEAAAVHLGCEMVIAEGFDENEALNTDYARLVDGLQREIAQQEADCVLVCLPSFNQDHRVLYDAFITATRPVDHMPARQLWAYEYPGNAWGPQPPQHGHYVRLTTSEMHSKLNALREHKTQFTDRTGHVTPNGALALAALRGSEVGVEYAEKFYLLRSIE